MHEALYNFIGVAAIIIAILALPVAAHFFNKLK